MITKYCSECENKIIGLLFCNIQLWQLLAGGGNYQRRPKRKRNNEISSL